MTKPSTSTVHTSQSALRFPLTAALGSTAGLRTARALFSHGGEISAPTLVRHTRLAKASVSKALATLTALGVIEKLGVGRSILYRVNCSHPLHLALQALFAAERARFDAILAAIRSAAEKAGVLAVWLYGSAARGEDAERSDVDIVVVAETGARKGLHASISEALREAGETYFFSPSLITLDTDDIRRLDRERDPWWASLLKDAWALSGDRPEWLVSALKRGERQNDSKDAGKVRRSVRNVRPAGKGSRLSQGRAGDS